MIKFSYYKIRRKQGIDVIIEAHNDLVDALAKAYDEINRLSKEIEQLKGGAE